MKTGDADVTLWLEPGGDRHWCLQVWSKRRGKMKSKRWEVPVYFWSVELWGDSGDDPVLRTRPKMTTTFNEAMRLARRWADALERARRLGR